MKNNEFDNYMNNTFKKKSLKEKQNETLEQLKVLSILSNKMCNDLKIENEILISKELLDINKKNYTEDDYAEAILVYINSIQNSLCDFNDKLADIMEYILNKI